MSPRPDVDRLMAKLWPGGDRQTGPQVYALLDGARDRRIEPLLAKGELAYQCLYAGKLSRAVQAAAPYIAHLEPEVRRTRELLELAWGNSWGVFTVVPWGVTTDQQRRHFRTLLRVKDESGRQLVFRFYDPRVLRIYLPTCTTNEAAQFFGPVSSFVAEGEDPLTMLSFTRGGTGVTTATTELAAAGAAPQ